MRRREFIASWAAALAAQPQSSFRVGFAERDITPDIGMEQPGGYGKVFHRSFHDPCKVRAAVFDDGQRAVAIVSVDALMVPRDLVLAARGQIRGLDGVMVSATHSHSSGPTGMVQPHQYDHASPLVRKLAYEMSSCADPGYLARVQAEIVRAVLLAADARQEALACAGSGTEDKAGYNRRIRMKSGVTFSHPGKSNPENDRYAGPIDPQVGVIGAWDRKGRLLGCIVNYACHATTNPGGISANWIYYLEQTIRGAMQADVPVVFMQGPCGDVTQVDNLSPYANPGAEQWAAMVGGRVGAEAVKVLRTATPGTLTPVAARSQVLRIPRRRPDPEKVRRALDMVSREGRGTDWTFAKETAMLDALIEKEPQVDVEVQAVQVGPALFVSNPAEYFVEYGLKIKAGSPFPLTMPVELANGCVGYVPTEEAFSPHGGGYETRLTSYSNLEVTAGRHIAETSIALARQMQPGKIPMPPLAPKGKPWDYGSVPPEVR